MAVRAIGTKTGERIVEMSAHAARRRQAAAAERDVAAPRDANETAFARLHALLELQSARIAGVLHDDVSQVLAAVHLAIEEVAGDAVPADQARLHQIHRHLHEVAEQLRRISHDLHPGILDHLPAKDAISSIFRAFTRRTGIRLTLSIDPGGPHAGGVDANLYRFVEEALANISAHAHAASASITIARDGSHLVATVTDDGIGFDPSARPAGDMTHGLGLSLLRGRLEAIGGTLEIRSAPRQGTRLRAVIPVEI